MSFNPWTDSMPPLHTCHLDLQVNCPACLQERRQKAQQQAWVEDARRFLRVAQERNLITAPVAQALTTGHLAAIGAAMSFARENAGVADERPGGLNIGSRTRFEGLDFGDADPRSPEGFAAEFEGNPLDRSR